LRAPFGPRLRGKSNLTLGLDVAIQPSSIIDARVGRVHIECRARIGRNVTILTTASNSSIHDAEVCIWIGADARVGDDSLVLPGAHIGEGAWIAPCSVVSGNVEPHTIAAGCPARRIGHRDRLHMHFAPAANTAPEYLSGIDRPPASRTHCERP